MALIAPSSLVADISGRVGDNVFSKNRGGLYVREGTSPVQPNSSPQIASRLFMSQAVTAWNLLTDDEVKEWATIQGMYSNKNRLGFVRPLQVRNFYISCFINRRYLNLSGSPLPVVPPHLNISRFEVSVVEDPFPNANLYGDPANDDFGVALYSHDATDISVRSINTLPIVYYSFDDYEPFPTNLGLIPWSDAFTGYTTTGLRRVFIKVRVIHKDSGILIAEMWNQNVKDNSAPPYELGYSTIGSGSWTSSDAIGLYASPIQDANFSKAFAYFKGSSPPSCRMALFRDSGLGYDQIGETNLLASPVASAWNEFTFTSPVSVSAYDVLLIAIHGSGSITIANNDLSAVFEDNTAPSADFNDPYVVTGTPLGNLSLYVSE